MLPKDLKIDPNQFAGKRAEFGNVSIEFGKGKRHGDVLIQRKTSTQAQQEQMMAMQFQQVLRGDIPPICGMCNYCKSVDYKGAGIPTCTHPNAPDREGQPLFVDPTLPPEEQTRFCAMHNEFIRKQTQVFDMKALPGRRETKRGQRTYTPTKGKK